MKKIMLGFLLINFVTAYASASDTEVSTKKWSLKDLFDAITSKNYCLLEEILKKVDLQENVPGIGETPLTHLLTTSRPFYDCHDTFKNMLKALLKLEGSVNKKNPRGDTPLIVASQMGHLEVVEHFINNHESELSVDEYGQWQTTALMHAAVRHHEKIVEILLKQHADPNKVDFCNRTVLHLVVQEPFLRALGEEGDNQIIKMITLLLAHGADLFAKDQDGNRPIQTCRIGMNGETRKSVVEFLRKKESEIIA